MVFKSKVKEELFQENLSFGITIICQKGRWLLQ